VRRTSNIDRLEAGLFASNWAALRVEVVLQA
jgi:hypothetical protein